MTSKLHGCCLINSLRQGTDEELANMGRPTACKSRGAAAAKADSKKRGRVPQPRIASPCVPPPKAVKLETASPRAKPVQATPPKARPATKKPQGADEEEPWVAKAREAGRHVRRSTVLAIHACIHANMPLVVPQRRPFDLPRSNFNGPKSKQLWRSKQV